MSPQNPRAWTAKLVLVALVVGVLLIHAGYAGGAAAHGSAAHISAADPHDGSAIVFPADPSHDGPETPMPLHLMVAICLAVPAAVIVVALARKLLRRLKRTVAQGWLAAQSPAVGLAVRRAKPPPFSGLQLCVLRC